MEMRMTQQILWVQLPDITDRQELDIKVRHTLIKACQEAGCMICGVTDYQFPQQGYSVAIVLGESHATIHTWPESGKAYVDFTSCVSGPGFSRFEATWKREGFKVLNSEITPRVFPGENR